MKTANNINAWDLLLQDRTWVQGHERCRRARDHRNDSWVTVQTGYARDSRNIAVNAVKLLIINSHRVILSQNTLIKFISNNEFLTEPHWRKGEPNDGIKLLECYPAGRTRFENNFRWGCTKRVIARLTREWKRDSNLSELRKALVATLMRHVHTAGITPSHHRGTHRLKNNDFARAKCSQELEILKISQCELVCSQLYPRRNTLDLRKVSDQTVESVAISIIQQQNHTEVAAVAEVDITFFSHIPLRVFLAHDTVTLKSK